MDARYEIPEGNMVRLGERVAACNKRAKRLGQPEIKFEIEDVIVKDSKRADAEGQVLRSYMVHIVGEPVVVSGWRFVATLQHEDGVNLIRTLPGETLPEEYRTQEAKCDHCKTARFRKDTYVLASEDDQYQQVGSSCLKDFTGAHDPHKAAAWAELLIEFEADLNGGEYFGTGGGKPRWRVPYILALTDLVTQKYGWVSRGKAAELQRIATADHVANLLDGDITTWRDYELEKPSFEQELDYQKIAEWCVNYLNEKANSQGLDDYEWNLQVVLNVGDAGSRELGLTCSALSFYHRQQEQIRKRAEKPEGQFVGEVGKRMVFENLHLIRIIDIDGYFGTTCLHKFQDGDGNLLVWFATSERLYEDEYYKVKGTVKEHSEYNGEKQTILTRCKATQIEKVEA